MLFREPGSGNTAAPLFAQTLNLLKELFEDSAKYDLKQFPKTQSLSKGVIILDSEGSSLGVFYEHKPLIFLYSNPLPEDLTTLLEKAGFEIVEIP